MESKESKVLELFFDEPTKEWHFEEIVQRAGIARSKACRWLEKFQKEGLIRKIKERGKMPHYVSNHDLPAYRQRKKLFALQGFYDAGLLNHLAALDKAKVVILFGSFARSDWHKKSDIDIFIYGDSNGFDSARYEARLHREMHVFVADGKGELNKLGIGLIRNVLKGNIIKGEADFVKVELND